jgi:hypothetical protein
MTPSPDTAALVGEVRELLATWQQMLDSGVVFIEDLAAEFPAAPTLIAQLCDALEGAEAELAELRAAAKDSGIRYCVVHHGIIEQDASVCDFYDDEDGHAECASRPLVYFAAAATTLREGAPE